MFDILTAHKCITAPAGNFSATPEQLVKDFDLIVVNGRKHAKAPVRSLNIFIKHE